MIKIRLYILMFFCMLLVLFSCTSSDEDVQISCDKILLCSEDVNQDSLYLMLKLKNTSKSQKKYKFLNMPDIADNATLTNSIVYSVMMEIDSTIVYFDPLFVKDGYVEIAPEEELKLLFMTTNKESNTSCKILKNNLLENMKGGGKPIELSLVEFTRKDTNVMHKTSNLQRIEFDYAVINVIDSCNLSFQDKLDLVDGEIEYL